MTATNKFVTDSGLDYDGKKWNTKTHIEIDLPSDDTPPGFGRSITPRAFRKMIGDKLLKLKDEFRRSGAQQNSNELEIFLAGQKCSVDFGKESILRILSQKGCDGLRFTFCLNDQMDESIIVSAYVEDKGESVIINKDAYRKENLDNPITTFDDEKGVGKSYADFVKQTGIPLEELMKGDAEKTTTKFVDGVLGLL